MSLELNKPEWIVQMEGVLETLNEGVLIVDDCNHIIFINEVLANLAGLTRDDVLGREPEHFYQGADRAFLTEQIARSAQYGQMRYEFYVPHKDGRRIPVLISTRVVEDPDGRWFHITTFTDISDLKEVEGRLRQVNRQLEERQQEIEHDLALAARVQRSLAPRALRSGPLAVDTYYLPVRTIGGDFGLVTPLRERELNLLVCDVSGHGIGSALVANRIYVETCALLERCRRLDEMLHGLNRFVLQQIRETGFYFTLAAARIVTSDGNGRTHAMSFTGAGHPPAFWLSAAGELRKLESHSRILGLLEDAVADFPVVDVELSRGDRLVLYTDGLTDVFDRRGEHLGVDGFAEIVRAAARRPFVEMKQAIVDQVEALRHGPISDDISLVLVEIQ